MVEKARYIMINLIDRETVETQSNKCPLCREPDSLRVTDTFARQSIMNSGLKWQCANCGETFVSVDTAPEDIKQQIQDEQPILIEFFLDEVEELVELEYDIIEEQNL